MYCIVSILAFGSRRAQFCIQDHFGLHNTNVITIYTSQLGMDKLNILAQSLTQPLL